MAGSRVKRGKATVVAEAVAITFFGLLGMIITGSIFMLFFVAIITAYVWETHTRTKELEKRLTALENKAQEGEPKKQQ